MPGYLFPSVRRTEDDAPRTYREWMSAVGGGGVESPHWMMPDETAPIPGQGMVGDLLMGLGKKVAKVAAHGMPLLFGRTVFHGSPYKFDKFLKEKIGTGEGAQAYGHGLYFAENPKVAGQYRMAGQAGYLNQRSAQIVNDAMEQAGGDAVKARNYLHQTAMSLPVNQRQPYFDAHNNFYKILEGGTGSLYHVDLPDSKIEKMLDWDKPLGEQGKGIQKLLSGVGAVEPTDGMKLAGGGTLRVTNDPDFGRKYFLEMGGKRFPLRENEVTNLVGTGVEGKSVYQALSTKLGGDKAASEYLYSLGIPGIKYLDAGSRAGGKGTRNFVVFNPDDVKILERK